MWARQSTAVSFVVGPVLDSTGAEYASAVIGDLSLSKAGGTLTALASTATLTYVANGQYTLALTSTNTNTLGAAQVTCNKSTYQMPTLSLMVLPASVYDALTANATNATGGLPTATGAISALAGALSTFAGGAVASVTGAVGSVTGSVGGSVGSVTGDVGGKVVGGGVTAMTGIGVRANNGADSTIPSTAVTAAIQARTDLIPSSPAAVGSAMTLAANAVTTAAIADGAITDAKITAPAEATGQPTGILGMVRRLWESSPWGNKRVRLRTTGVARLRNAADSADLVSVTQSSTTVGSDTTDTQTRGA